MTTFVNTILALVILCFVFPPPTKSSDNQTDLLSLLAIKSSLQDPLGALNSWNQTLHFCSWSGIQCSSRHRDRVVAINLPSRGLVGNLSPHVGNLSFLKTIILRNNTFHGPIPTEITQLRRLQFLEFSNNSFVGTIPTNLSHCRNLVQVHLIKNLISGSIPTELGLLSKLKDLALSRNNLSGLIPPSVGNITTLTRLSLVSCGLAGEIPESLGRLHRLKTLQLSENSFTGTIPSNIYNLSSIVYFDVSFNQFHGVIPSTIFLTLPNLDCLNVEQNQFNGRIPASISNASSDEVMKLSSISIVFNLSHNALVGSIPEEVGSLENLGALDLSSNRLSGLIPDAISSCASLGILYLHDNLLEGEVPSGLSALMGLQDLDLSQNNLYSLIPEFLGNMKIGKLNLSFNKLYGEVPMKGIFANKTSVSLDGNQGLCGGVSDLKLPPCPGEESPKRNLSTVLKILIPILVTGCLMLVVFITYKRRIMFTKSLSSFVFSNIGVQFMRLSYADLQRATSGFSDGNLVGVGRFGSVYKGVLDDGTTFVAVKVVNLVVRGASKTFLAECKALRGIRHRNLVKLVSVCDSIDFQGNNFKALVYEFKVNGSLEKWLHREESGGNFRILSIIERLNIAIDIARGIHYLHFGTGSCIVHGDLKPSNILLDHEMVACVGDFGLAKIVLNIHPLHESNSSIVIKGTLGYIPPEYGTFGVVSMQGDVYSYGIILLEMFTNKRPTDDFSDDDLNLHNFVSAALPDRVMEIVDPIFLTEPDLNIEKLEKCMMSVLSIGVSCSKEIAKDRMSITHVVNDLSDIKELFFS